MSPTTDAGHAPALERRGRLRWLDALTLVAVGVVVLLVTLPRLREFALNENEGDAQRLVAHLGELLANPVHAAETSSVEQLVHASKDFAKQLDDVEFLDGGRVLRRHGYLFDLGPNMIDASAAPGMACVPCVRAWPWQYKHTGLSVFTWSADTGLQANANARGEWSGPGQPPPSAPDPSAGWTAVPPR